MKKIIVYLTLTFLVISCAATGVYTPLGSALIKIDKEPITLGNTSSFKKNGEACSFNILGIYAGGDSSIVRAAQKGEITKIATVDRSIMNVLFIFGRVCTEVTGE
ncbi:MAG: hypothetical protein CK427_05885 [Leptospira sp.]|nr:MAG: hypothetical protein CK427_05885 [Leptospira sp.]